MVHNKQSAHAAGNKQIAKGRVEMREPACMLKLNTKIAQLGVFKVLFCLKMFKKSKNIMTYRYSEKTLLFQMVRTAIFSKFFFKA